MCKIYRDYLTDQLQFAAFTSHDVMPSKEARKRMLEAIVNGEFLRSDYHTSVAHAIMLSMSTISALSKDLELDLASSKALTSKEEVEDVARNFGRYVYLPVLQFQSTMRRLLYASWNSRSHCHSLQRLIMKFLNMFEEVDVDSRAMIIIASHMLFAIYSAKLYDCGKHAMPFTISVNGRGKFYLVYHYINKKTRRQRVIRWNLGLRLPSGPNPLLLNCVGKI